jgi:hypothetical protein
VKLGDSIHSLTQLVTKSLLFNCNWEHLHAIERKVINVFAFL